jgi:transcriptional regulator with XRE-family HTH domain
MKSLKARFGELLRELREKRGLTQDELGTDANLDRTYISLLERGLRQPTLEVIFTLAKALNVSPSSMIKRLEA